MKLLAIFLLLLLAMPCFPEDFRVKSGTFMIKDLSDADLIADIVNTNDTTALKQLKKENRIKQIEGYTECSIISSMSSLKKIRLKGTIDSWWVRDIDLIRIGDLETSVNEIPISQKPLYYAKQDAYLIKNSHDILFVGQLIRNNKESILKELISTKRICLVRGNTPCTVKELDEHEAKEYPDFKRITLMGSDSAWYAHKDCIEQK